MAVRQYSDEFKKNALHLLETSGKRLTEIERELGIPHGLLRKWQAKWAINPSTEALEVSEVAALQAEIKRLHRELERVTMEREILKKTVGIFSKSP